MSERPEPPAEARLIAAALKRSRMSVREAARRAPMSEGRWRQIMNGYQTVSAGHDIPVTGPAETVARMAAVVGVTATQLEGAGREDAAQELRELTPDEAAPPRRDPQTWAELTALAEEDPAFADTVLNLVRTAQRLRAQQPEPPDTEEQQRKRDAG